MYTEGSSCFNCRETVVNKMYVNSLEEKLAAWRQSGPFEVRALTCIESRTL
jgi:hypothetical protein